MIKSAIFSPMSDVKNVKPVVTEIEKLINRLHESDEMLKIRGFRPEEISEARARLGFNRRVESLGRAVERGDIKVENFETFPW